MTRMTMVTMMTVKLQVAENTIRVSVRDGSLTWAAPTPRFFGFIAHGALGHGAWLLTMLLPACFQANRRLVCIKQYGVFYAAAEPFFLRSPLPQQPSPSRRLLISPWTELGSEGTNQANNFF